MSTLFSLRNVRQHGLCYPDMDIGECCTSFITGASGCGKSSLFCLLNGTAQAESGTLVYRNRPIEDYEPLALRREVLLVGQQVFLFDGSIQDNFATFYEYRHKPCPSAATMLAMLALCQLDMPLHTACAHLSGGERQRVYVALFLSLQTPVLLLDEPSAALDAHTAHAMLGALHAHCQARGASLLVISHDVSLAQRYAHTHIALPTPHKEQNHE
jgi:putative ABC transport system ATP-binding protein